MLVDPLNLSVMPMILLYRINKVILEILKITFENNLNVGLNNVSDRLKIDKLSMNDS